MFFSISFYLAAYGKMCTFDTIKKHHWRHRNNLKNEQNSFSDFSVIFPDFFTWTATQSVSGSR